MLLDEEGNVFCCENLVYMQLGKEYTQCFYMYLTLSPDPFPAFQCCTMKCGWVWYSCHAHDVIIA